MRMAENRQIPHNLNALFIRGCGRIRWFVQRDIFQISLAMAHEDLTRDQQVEGSSDRSFGLVFAIAFLLIGAWPLFHGAMPRWWAGAIATVFALVAVVRPALLSGLNRLWITLGILLAKVVSPLALGILFYGVLTPIGAVMRFLGKDPLRLKHDAATASYWIERKPPGPPPNSMTNQF